MTAVTRKQFVIQMTRLLRGGPVSATMPTVNELGLQGCEHQLVILSHGRRIGARGEDATVDLGLSQPFTQEAKYREFILIPLIPDRCYRASICSSFRMAPRYQPRGEMTKENGRKKLQVQHSCPHNIKLSFFI